MISGINLEKHLVGTWRWQVDGRPMRLLQLLTIQGTLREGAGVFIFLDGSKQGESAIVSLSDALSGFWEGQVHRRNGT